MIITNKKIQVTFKMMEEKNMTRFGELGIPKDINNPSLGLIWKDMFRLNNDDFDIIESYFIKLGEQFSNTN